MKIIFTSLLSLGITCSALAQLQVTNPGFENWGNASPGNANEPTSWYSNKSGSATAQIGPQTCFKDSTIKHGGNYSVRVETVTTGIPFNVIVNGNVTTGVINAPSLSKSDGYIGTQNYDDTSGDVRRMAFTGRPDSVVGWYQYNQGGHAAEQGKLRFIFHTGQYYDPETPTTYHPACLSNKIGDASFTTPASDVATWTRFSVPVTYSDTSAPAYIMINITSSADQQTTVDGSKLWVDDLEMIYNPLPNKVTNVNVAALNVNVYSYGRTLFADCHNADGAVADISVFDMTGRLLLTRSLEQHKLNTVALPDMAAGIYLYKVSSNGYQKTGKFVIE